MSETVPFDPVAAARLILRQARTGALATLLPNGAPFATLVTVATDPVGAPVLLLSSLAVHTINLAADARASLLLEGQAIGDPLQGGRVTLNGSFRLVPRSADTLIRRRFLARQPEARLYAGFRDFDFWQMAVEDAHLVAGFGRIVKIPAADLLLDGAVIAEAEDKLVAEANAALPGGPWRVIGFDAEGVDFGRETETCLDLRRLRFPRPIGTIVELSAALKEIAIKPIE